MKLLIKRMLKEWLKDLKPTDGKQKSKSRNVIKNSKKGDTDMKRYVRDYVWFTGSRRTLERTLYKDELDRLYCKWYGQFIEVKKGQFGYSTVEAY